MSSDIIAESLMIYTFSFLQLYTCDKRDKHLKWNDFKYKWTAL